MAIFAKFNLAGTDINGDAHNVDVAAGAGLDVPDLNGATVIQSTNFGSAVAGAGAGGQSYNVSCTKEIDEGTPKFMEALDNNQKVDAIIYLSRMSDGADGTNEEVYLTAEIKGGRVLGQTLSEAGDGMGNETLTLKYDSLIVTYKGGITYTIKWAKRK